MRHEIWPPLDRPYLSNHGWFTRDRADFINPLKGIRKTIVDDRGNILGFPGIAHPEIVLHLLDGNQTVISPTVHYGMEFLYQGNGTHLVRWELQPDGCYWADDGGFGMGNEPEIQLYSYLDEAGSFTAPFRIHHVGQREYFGTDREENLVRRQSLRRNSSFDKTMDTVIPEFLAAVAAELRKPDRQRRDQERNFSLEGFSQLAHIEFSSSSRGGNIQFCILRDQEKYQGLPQYVTNLEEGSAQELLCFVTAPGTLERIKYQTWNYCQSLEETYEEIREKYGRR